MPKVRLVRDALDQCCGSSASTSEVDGGIDESTVVEAARAGANVFVSGSAVFGFQGTHQPRRLPSSGAAAVGAAGDTPSAP